MHEIPFYVVRTGLSTGDQCSTCDDDATYMVADRAEPSKPHEPYCLFCIEKDMANGEYPAGVSIRKLKLKHGYD